MDHFIDIYQRQAAAYQAMITAEDADGRLLPAIQEVAPIHGRRLLDLGTGTGRIPLLCHRLARRIVALDRHEAMLRQNRLERERAGGRWSLLAGDMGALPFPAGSFDVVVAAWALGHFTGWYGDGWRERAGRVLAEMVWVADTAGTLLILETLGTGVRDPAPPNAALADYYAWLEEEHGFQRREMATDYQFASPEAAVAAMEFFFGPELSARIRRNSWSRVPEWTGLWFRPVTPR